MDLNPKLLLVLVWLSLAKSGISCDITWGVNKAEKYLWQSSTRQGAKAPTADHGCTAAAVSFLADSQAEIDPVLLADYLAVLRPNLSGMIIVSDSNVGQLYPALGRVVKAGRKIEPKLLELIGGSTGDFALRRNACRAIHLIYREDPLQAVKVLRLAAQDATAPRRQALLEAAGWISTWEGLVNPPE